MTETFQFEINFLLRNNTNSITGNKLNAFGRINSISTNPVKAHAIPIKGHLGVANAPKKNMNKAIDIGNSVEIASEYHRSRG